MWDITPPPSLTTSTTTLIYHVRFKLCRTVSR